MFIVIPGISLNRRSLNLGSTVFWNNMYDHVLILKLKPDITCDDTDAFLV